MNKYCFVGTDSFGNKYFENREKTKNNKRKKRWVEYAGKAEASKVTAKWYNWLHYQEDNPPVSNITIYDWEEKSNLNLTGTTEAYFPKGCFRKKKRDKAVGDYESWKGIIYINNYDKI